MFLIFGINSINYYKKKKKKKNYIIYTYNQNEII